MERARPGRPVFTVIGGPNGAGKSTYTEGLAANDYPLGEVVNPDMIAAALPGPDVTRHTRAGRETLKRTRVLIASGQTFSRETTLSGSEILRTMQGAKEAGFRVNLFFVGVDSLETSRRRVEDRVSKGGHEISPGTCRNVVSAAASPTRYERYGSRIRRCLYTAGKNNSKAWAWLDME